MESIISAASAVYLAVPGIKLTKKQKISVGNHILKDAENAHTFFSRYLSPTDMQILVKEHAEAFLQLCQGAKDFELRSAITAKLKEAKPKAQLETQFDQTVPVSMNTVRFINNVENVDYSFLYNPDTEEMYQLDRRHVMSKLKQHIPDDDQRAQWLATHTDDRVIRYETFKPKTYEDSKGRKVYNRWTPATYAIDWDVAAHPEYTSPPEDYLKVLRHVFANPKEHPYVNGWVREAVFDRNKTILLATGAPGAGKGVFTEHILSNLVGADNWTKAAPNFESSQFHGDIRGRMIYVLNELEIRKATKDKLKDMADGKITMNEKNEKIKGTEEIYASFIVTNNYRHLNKLELNDRKFFVPELAEEKLDDVYGEPWVTNFCEVTCKDPAFLRHLAAYLYHHVKPVKTYPKTETFYKICELNHHPYLKKFLAHCKNKPAVAERDLTKSVSSRNRLDFYEFKQLLTTYEKETKTKVADIIEGLEGWSAVSHLYTEEAKAETAKANAKAMAVEKERVAEKYSNGKDHTPAIPVTTQVDEDIYTL